MASISTYQHDFSLLIFKKSSDAFFGCYKCENALNYRRALYLYRVRVNCRLVRGFGIVVENTRGYERV